MQLDAHIKEGDIQLGRHGAGPVHDVQEQGGHRQLQQKLLNGSQALVLLFLHLCKVIQKSHKAEAKGQDQHIKHAEIIHKGKIAKQHDNGGSDEHETAHHGGACLIIVPDGAHFPDGLSHFHSPEHGDQQIANAAG